MHQEEGPYVYQVQEIIIKNILFIKKRHLSLQNHNTISSYKTRHSQSSSHKTFNELILFITIHPYYTSLSSHYIHIIQDHIYIT